MDTNEVGRDDTGKGREEQAGNSLPRNVDPESKDTSLPSPVMRPYNAEYLSKGYKNQSEAKNFSNLTSMIGSAPPGLIVDDLTNRNIRPNSSRKGQWQHLYQLASGSRSNYPPQDKGQRTSAVKEESARTPSSIKSLKPLSNKKVYGDPAKTSVPFRDSDEKIASANKVSAGGTRLRQLSTSGFSHFLAIKSEGVASTSIEAPSGRVLGQNDDKMICVIEAASDVLLKSSVNNEKHYSPKTDRPGPGSSPSGICLREYLQPGRPTINKVETLSLFKQIVELVDFSHAQEIALLDLRPSHFILLPSHAVKYTGPLAMRELGNATFQDLNEKRPLEQYVNSYHPLGAKKQKLSEGARCVGWLPQFTSSSDFKSETVNDIDVPTSSLQDSRWASYQAQNESGCENTSVVRQNPTTVIPQLEKKWYASPEELKGRGSCTFSSNIYNLGVLLFELLSTFESQETHHTAMLDLRHRILPPHFLSENQVEAGLCLWLLHPEPSSRPTTRKIKQSELLCSSPPQELHRGDEISGSVDSDAPESELLLKFLVLLKDQKLKHASKVVEDIESLEEDMKEIERRHLKGKALFFPWTRSDSLDASDKRSHPGGPKSSDARSRLFLSPSSTKTRLMGNISLFENAYFSMRSQSLTTESDATERTDKNVLKDREKSSQVLNENDKLSMNHKCTDRLGVFYEGLCKFARYSKFEARGMLRNGDLLNSANVICSLSFDRDQEYIAAAGVSKKIKIFEFSALSNESMDIHYPVVEMSNNSKLSCVCWNNYIKNYLASADYHGVVQMWDASTGQRFSQYTEHQKRAWSVDFSLSDPTILASGSDDRSVKFWNINQKDSISTISNSANVCCVQFSPYSSHLLASGSADYRIYCYDLRNTLIPWCTLVGHDKAVSYVKFLDSETLVSASTDNTIKVWDLNKTSSVGLSSNACVLTLRGHSNEKNFVGLSAMDGYIACGSETNEVYSYYKSLPMPIMSHKFGSIDPISGQKISDDNGQFVSSVCWRKKSNMLVAANSSGNIKLLQMV